MFYKFRKSLLVSLSITFYFSYDLVRSAISFATERADWATLICSTLMAILLVLSIVINFKSIKPYSVLVVAFVALSILVTATIHPEYYQSMFVDNNVLEQVFGLHRGIAIFFLFTMVKDPKELLLPIKIGAFSLFVDRAIKTLQGGAYLDANNHSNHEFGYIFLFSAAVFLLCFIKDKGFRKCFDIVIFALSSFFLILIGARTTIIAYALFFALVYLFVGFNKKVFFGKVIKLSVFVAFVCLLFIAFREIMINNFSSIVSSSKILEAIFNGGNELDGGRLVMYENNKRLLNNNWFGLGVYWDRYTYSDFTYTHNFFYELIVGYGWIIGGLILFWLIISSARVLLSKSDKWKVYFIVFFSLWSIRLFLSYSFWIDFSFWATIGIIINFNYYSKHDAKTLLDNEQSCNNDFYPVIKRSLS